MKIISSALLFVVFTAVLAQYDETTTLETTSEVSTTDVSSTRELPTTSSSVPTTRLTPTTTTLESTTTTSSPPTTPVISTTSSSTTSTSTTSTSTTSTSTTSTSTRSSSSSSTTEITSTAIATSTVTPEPKKCQFNATCIKADITADFVIDVEDKKHIIPLGCNASISDSDCSSNVTQTLVLFESTYRLTMVFEKDSGKVLVKNVTFSYNLPNGTRGTVSNTSENLFNVNAGKSYLCKSKFDVPLDNVTMEIKEIRIQAFLEEDKDFSLYEECTADEKVSDIVPIAVGIALAALIIIVLIAYLVGRRRSRQKGYQSV